jgi:hypothetical protein
MAEQCTNNADDRRLGALWEERFCAHARRTGRAFTAHQAALKSISAMWHVQGASRPLPDVTLWTAPVEHHEIKHKDPTRAGEFGLETYRFQSLTAFAEESRTRVLYTIHDHSRSGGRDSHIDQIEDWLTVDVLNLLDRPVRRATGKSWVNGKPKDVEVCYWPVSLWVPLASHWEAVAA